MVKFYHILAFAARTADGIIASGHYLGKTSDLVFKVEQDKTIDLDDGNTEVGSEKLNVSFSLLGELKNPWEFCEIWLVPVCSSYVADSPEIIKIFIVEGDYHLETKSGDFKKTLFSATRRYALDTPQYESIPYYFEEYFMLFSKILGTDGEVVVVMDSNVPPTELLNLTPDDAAIEYSCVVYLPFYNEYTLKFNGDDILGLDPIETEGIIRSEIDLQ